LEKKRKKHFKGEIEREREKERGREREERKYGLFT
jgi:hypothetical protein